MQFKIDSFYKHNRFRDLIIKILEQTGLHEYEIAYYTLGYNPKKPVFIGFSSAYSIDKNEDWVEYHI